MNILFYKNISLQNIGTFTETSNRQTEPGKTKDITHGKTNSRSPQVPGLVDKSVCF